MEQETLQGGAPRGGLADRLRQLEEQLVASSPSFDALRDSSTPQDLDMLFHLLLCRQVRGGPPAAPEDDALTLRRLLSVAQGAASTGVLRVASVMALRSELERLESELTDGGFWHHDRPLWWRPLPPPSVEEELWRALASEGEMAVDWPERSSLEAAFNPSVDGRGWQILPRCLPPDLTRRLYAELENAFQDGRLALQREGVGVRGQVSTRRSDWVTYTSGLEPEILAASPGAAVLAQKILAELPPLVATLLPGRRLSPPQTAMLARYPAPSTGYAAHLDNPGGERDNGRALTLVLYLNAPEEPCRGGEIALWDRDASTDEPPSETWPAHPGSAVLFASRDVAHRVLPLAEGPARWALTVWLNDTPQPPRIAAPRLKLVAADALLRADDPPLPPGTVLMHELDDVEEAGRITVHRRSGGEPRIALVCTVYRGGAVLDRWCAHHVAMGVDHLVVVFDHLSEPEEAADAARLRSRYPADALTVWSGEDLAHQGWSELPEAARPAELLRLAGFAGAAHAVASRQTLNASAALRAAKRRELGEGPYDWMIHLDVDELLYLEGSGRGGTTLKEHFDAATTSGFKLIRYLNHELLLPHSDDAAARFKLNPRLAVARLGSRGWSSLVEHLKIAATDPRPYFNGYLNGKSAVVVEAGRAAAGVHGWFLEEPPGTGESCLLAGPSVLHCHFMSTASFLDKYLAIASSGLPSSAGLFEPSPTEVAALDLIRNLERRGVDAVGIEKELCELHERRTSFAAEEIELLEEAGLILRPRDLCLS